MTFGSIVGAILVLAACVLLHELGHFVSALALGILVCIGLILYMLFFQQPQNAYYPGAYLVREAVFHAATV